MAYGRRRRRHLLIRKRNSCTDRVFPGICIHMELHKVYWYQNRRRCLKAETQLLEEKLLWKKKVRATKPFFWTRMSIHRRRANWRVGIWDLIYFTLVLKDSYLLKSRRTNPDHVVCLAISFKHLKTWVFANTRKPQPCSQPNETSWSSQVP